MTLSYDDIFNSFLGLVNDYDIASMNMQDAYDSMMEWLKRSFRKPYVRRLFSSALMDDEIQTFVFEMSFNTTEDADKDFIMDVLSKGMVIEWLQPQVKSKLLTNQMFSGKEQKFFAQANHLDQLRGLLEDSKLEQRKMIRDRGYISNSYLEGQS